MQLEEQEQASLNMEIRNEISPCEHKPETYPLFNIQTGLGTERKVHMSEHKKVFFEQDDPSYLITSLPNRH